MEIKLNERELQEEKRHLLFRPIQDLAIDSRPRKRSSNYQTSPKQQDEPKITTSHSNEEQQYILAESTPVSNIKLSSRKHYNLNKTIAQFPQNYELSPVKSSKIGRRQRKINKSDCNVQNNNKVYSIQSIQEVGKRIIMHSKRKAQSKDHKSIEGSITDFQKFYYTGNALSNSIFNQKKRSLSKNQNLNEGNARLPEIGYNLSVTNYLNGITNGTYEHGYYQQRKQSIAQLKHKLKQSPTTRNQMKLNQIMPSFKPRDVSFTTLQRQQVPFKFDNEIDLNQISILSNKIKNLNISKDPEVINHNNNSSSINQNYSTYYSSLKEQEPYLVDQSVLPYLAESKPMESMYKTSYGYRRITTQFSQNGQLDSKSQNIKRKSPKNRQSVLPANLSYDDQKSLQETDITNQTRAINRSKHEQEGMHSSTISSIANIKNSRNNSFVNSNTVLGIQKFRQKLNSSIRHPSQLMNYDYLSQTQENNNQQRETTPENIQNAKISVEIKYKENINNQDGHVEIAQEKSQRITISQPINQSPRYGVSESQTKLIKKQLENCNRIYGNYSSRKLKRNINHSSQSPKQMATIQNELESGKSNHKNSGILTPLQQSCEFKKICSSKEPQSHQQTRRMVEQSSKQITSPSPRTKTLRHDQSLISNISSKKIIKPPPFKLKDLPKYSKTLKIKDIDAFKFANSVLGGKYLKQQDQSPPRSPKTIEWTNTPVYKQFVLRLTEMESLVDSEIGFRKYKDRNRHKTYQQILLDLKSKKVIKQLIEESLKSIYQETEIEYLTKILKHKNPNQEQMLEMYDRAIDTLEVLMCKLGLKDQFQRVFEAYETEKVQNFIDTLLKIMTRCKIMYVSIGKISVIFKLIKKSDELQIQIAENNEKLKEDNNNNKTENLEQLETAIASFCYQSSRLFIQISQFMIESHLFKRLKFIYENVDYQQKIRKQVQHVKDKYEQLFGKGKIPTMNQLGKLIFEGDTNDGDNLEKL